jgi:16S rRNA (cytosine1402-N4)-methyltransferase
MPGEVLECLGIDPSGIYVDATVGLGGHAAGILEHLGPEGRLVGIDQDDEALAEAVRKLAGDFRVTILKGNFSEMRGLLASRGISGVSGVLMDLGVSSLQLRATGRGFSFATGDPLDMRMDKTSGMTAADVVNHSSEKEIADIIFNYGEEHRSRRIARAIVRSRPLATCADLAKVVESAVPRTGRIHPATRTFQALRIAVNRELEVLPVAIDDAARLLVPGGRICVISYHSLEDRIVKHKFRELDGTVLDIITRKPLAPSRQEVLANPPSRSAKLRAARKMEQSTDDSGHSSHMQKGGKYNAQGKKKQEFRTRLSGEAHGGSASGSRRFLSHLDSHEGDGGKVRDRTSGACARRGSD